MRRVYILTYSALNMYKMNMLLTPENTLFIF